MMLLSLVKNESFIIIIAKIYCKPLSTMASSTATATKKIAPIFLNSSNKKPASREVLSAENSNLKKKIVTLQKENEKLKQELRKRKAESFSSSSSSGVGAAAGLSNKKAKTPGQRKKLFEKWAKAAIRESAKTKLSDYHGGMQYTATIKETIPWTMTEFESLFVNSSNSDNDRTANDNDSDDDVDRNYDGIKIQPTPDNKPTSQIIIYHFNRYEAVRKLFQKVGNVEITKNGYTAQAWKSRNFCKSYRVDDYNASLDGLQVQYNKSRCTLQLLFEFETSDCYE